MNDKIVRMILAGVFFGTWPLLFNRSGLKGNLFTAIAIMVTFVCVIPFAMKEYQTYILADWRFAVGAFVTGTIGVVIFNNTIPGLEKVEASNLFVIMMMAQISIPAVNSVILNGLTVKKFAGFAFAFLAAVLLG